MAGALINLGNAFAATGEHQKAMECWRSALDLAKELQNHHQQAQLLNNMGILHYQLRNLADARLCYQEAQTLFRQMDSKPGLPMFS